MPDEPDIDALRDALEHYRALLHVVMDHRMREVLEQMIQEKQAQLDAMEKERGAMEGAMEKEKDKTSR